MKGIMLQGTSSDVGKSLIATLFCRLLADQGIRVAPFKSQNMSNNSYVTANGEEIGRAQGIQAEAARIQPVVAMNPILLKPQNDRESEVILFGKRHESLSGSDYRKHFYETGKEAIHSALAQLETEYEAVVIEGAGSPVEMNLNDRELVNMSVARMADVPVLLIADIDRGGVFASIAGTLALLDPEDRSRVKGILINKFRGDRSMFNDGVDWIESYTNLPVLGVLPYVTHHGIEQEDSLGVRAVASRSTGPIRIAVLEIPYISNFTDLEALAADPSVSLEWVTRTEELTERPHAVILPGTKSTIHAMRTIRQNGWPAELHKLNQQGTWLIGICGGYQLLGRELRDLYAIDSGEETMEPGLGRIPGITTFHEKKTVIQRSGTLIETATPVSGFEIHLGATTITGDDARPFIQWDTGETDGYVSKKDRLIGTYTHDIFKENEARSTILSWISGTPVALHERRDVYAELAETLKPHLDWDAILTIMGIDHDKR